MDNEKAEEIVKQVKDCAVEVYRVLGAVYEGRVYEEQGFCMVFCHA